MSKPRKHIPVKLVVNTAALAAESLSHQEIKMVFAFRQCDLDSREILLEMSSKWGARELQKSNSGGKVALRLVSNRQGGQL